MEEVLLWTDLRLMFEPLRGEVRRSWAEEELGIARDTTVGRVLPVMDDRRDII